MSAATVRGFVLQCSCVGSAWPLVGREEELAVVAEALATPDTAGVVVAGDAGVGKSRLLKEALAAAARDGYATASVAGFAATSSLPFGAFRGYPVEAGDDEGEILQGVVASILRNAAGRRLVLAVDDAHLLDGQSAAVVHRLALSGNVFLLMGVRSGEPSADPILTLWKDGLAIRFELQSLSRGEVGRLLTEALGGYVDVQTTQALFRESAGNPLLLHELVLQAIESRTFVHDGHAWRRTAPVAAGNRLAEVIRARLGYLDADERQVVELLAVAGTLDLASLDRLAAPATVASLEARGIITAEADGRRQHVRLGHPLYGEVLRPQLVLRSRALRTSLAEALEATGLRRSGDLLCLATWRLDSTTALDPALTVAAGRQAEILLDHGLAERLARAAVDAGGGFEAQLLLAEALTGRRDGEAAEELLARVAASADDDRRRTEVAVIRARNLVFNLNRWGEGQRLLGETAAAVDDAGCQASLALLQGQLAQLDGRYQAALDLVLPLADRPGTCERQLVRAMSIAATAYASLGNWAGAQAAADRGLLASSRLDGPLHMLEAELESYRWRGLMRERMADADRLATETFQQAMDEGYYEVAVRFAMPLGASALFQGKVRTAQRRLSEALQLVRRHDLDAQECGVLCALVEATVLMGDVATAAGLYERARCGVTFETFEPWLRRAEAWVAAGSGALAEASRLALRAADIAQRQGQTPAEACALHDVVRLGRVTVDVAGRLEALPADPLQSACASQARAALEKDGPGLDEAAAVLERIGAALWAAEALAMAAAVHRDEGRAAAARSSSARARALLDRCEGARSPALAALDGIDVRRLTDRQRHIASLAAEGLPSRTIAERLGLSVRTVDNQLARVYAALGISRRSELGRVLGPPPTD